MFKNIQIDFSKLGGTPFQNRVWKEIHKVKFGRTLTYKELARRVGRPKAYRATASACGKNPLPLIIPCHRIVASNGIGGFSLGVGLKRWLLSIEGLSY